MSIFEITVTSSSHADATTTFSMSPGNIYPAMPLVEREIKSLPWCQGRACIKAHITQWQWPILLHYNISVPWWGRGTLCSPKSQKTSTVWNIEEYYISNRSKYSPSSSAMKRSLTYNEKVSVLVHFTICSILISLILCRTWNIIKSSMLSSLHFITLSLSERTTDFFLAIVENFTGRAIANLGTVTYKAALHQIASKILKPERYQRVKATLINSNYLPIIKDTSSVVFCPVSSGIENSSYSERVEPILLFYSLVFPG